MEKIVFSANGQWQLFKAKDAIWPKVSKLGSELSFKHEYSNDMPYDKAPKRESNILDKGGPKRVHWFSVSHPEHGELGLLPVTTETKKDGPASYSHGFFFGDKEGNHDPSESPENASIPGVPQNAEHLNHAKNIVNNLKSKNLPLDDISYALQDHFANNYDNNKSKISDLHNGHKPAPFLYSFKKPNDNIQ